MEFATLRPTTTTYAVNDGAVVFHDAHTMGRFVGDGNREALPPETFQFPALEMKAEKVKTYPHRNNKQTK